MRANGFGIVQVSVGCEDIDEAVRAHRHRLTVNAVRALLLKLHKTIEMM